MTVLRAHVSASVFALSLSVSSSPWRSASTWLRWASGASSSSDHRRDRSSSPPRLIDVQHRLDARLGRVPRTAPRCRASRPRAGVPRSDRSRSCSTPCGARSRRVWAGVEPRGLHRLPARWRARHASRGRRDRRDHRRPAPSHCRRRRSRSSATVANFSIFAVAGRLVDGRQLPPPVPDAVHPDHPVRVAMMLLASLIVFAYAHTGIVIARDAGRPVLPLHLAHARAAALPDPRDSSSTSAAASSRPCRWACSRRCSRRSRCATT